MGDCAPPKSACKRLVSLFVISFMVRIMVKTGHDSLPAKSKQICARVKSAETTSVSPRSESQNIADIILIYSFKL